MSQIQKSPSGRTRRQPVGTRNRLSLHGKEEGYEYRIVTDVSDNIVRLQEQGYEHVGSDKIKVGDSRVNVSKGLGEHASISVGQGLQGYVMRIKKEWYDEDQAAKRAEIQKTKDTIKRVDKKDGDYGRVRFGKDE